MEFLRRVLEQIKTQLSALTVSQRLFIGTLLIIMCAAIAAMVWYAGQREQVPLLNQPFPQKELQRIAAKLDTLGEEYTIQGDRILVPQSEQKRLIAKLAYAGDLPEDTSIGWALLLEDSDIWTPESVRENKKLIVKQEVLRGIIEQFPGVDSARVLINEGGKRSLRNTMPTATASVMVQLSPSAGSTKQLATSIAALVAGSTTNLRRENVQVVADGQLVPIPAQGEEIVTDYLQLKTQYEERYRQKIMDVLEPATEALVQVDVTLQNTSTQRRVTKYDEEGDGSWLARTNETSNEHRSTQAVQSEEPGVMANVSTSSAGPGTPASEETTEESTRSSTAFAGTTETVEQTEKGGVRDITATVGISLAYFEQIAKQESGQDEPDTETVESVMAREIPRLRSRAMAAIGLELTPENEERVVVNSYWAGGPLGAGVGPNGETSQAGTGTVAGFAQRYGKHIAVSALAMLSLFMVLMMVRKAAGPVEIEEEEYAGPSRSTNLPDALGIDEAGGGDASGLLAGVELDESTVRTQQVMEQVKNLVGDSPESAASLISKWITEKD